MEKLLDFLIRKKLAVMIALLVIIAGVILLLSLKSVKKTQTQAEATAEISIAEAKVLAEKYMYDEALTVLESAGVSNSEATSLKQEIESKKASLVEYDGQFYHVFFHSLIVYPNLAFDGDYMHEGYDMWMTTVSEFKAMLPQLYERGFILVNITDIKEGAKMMLPEGKKPLVISIDDVNYYDYMENDGFADRLVVDENGKIATEVKNLNGDYEITYDGDVMPILDEFVEQHPDFSYRGAKGVVAVTGYEGAFGYNFIDNKNTKTEEEKQKLREEATKVATALKNNGWLIACHSYTHNDYFKDGTVSNENLHYDTNRFKERIYEVVLKPDIYISPFGYHLDEGDERLQYLKDMGYNYFCPVSPAMRTYQTKEGVIIQERFNLDRYNMRTKKDYINNTFFNVDSVYYNE